MVWKFNKDNIVVSDNIELEDAIVKQYESIFEKPVSAAVDESSSKPVEKENAPEVVKLFDE